MTSMKLKMQGYFTVEKRDPKTGLVTARKRVANLITRNGRNMVARMLLDRPGYDIGLTYYAIGTGTTAPNLSDAQLVTESARKLVTSREDTTTNIAAFFTFFTAGESGFDIREVGIFGHSTATSTADSGVLFARALLNIDNASPSEDLSLSYTLTIT